MGALGSNIYGFPEGQIIAFALVLIRVISFIIAWPIFSTNQVPVSVKIGLGLLLTLTMFPSIKFQNVNSIAISEDLILLVIREAVLGLFLGFLLRMFFFALSIAGELMSIAIGLASAQIFNPALGVNSNIVEQLQLLLATILFLFLNGHHLFLKGLAESFEVIPVAAVGFKYQTFSSVTLLCEQVITFGLKMAAPVVVSVFIANIAMGILGRAVPQINIFVTSLSVTIILGFSVLYFMIPFQISEMNSLLNLMAENFFQIMRAI